MAIVFQRASAAAVGTGSLTFDIGAAGNNRLVVIQNGDESTGTDDVFIGTVTVDTKSATGRLAKTNPDGAGNVQEFYTIDEAALGSSNGSVTIAWTGLDTGWGKRAALWYGVDSGVPTDTAFNDTAIGPTTPDIVMSVPANGLAVYGAGNGSSGGTDTWTSPLTERIDGATLPPASAVLGLAEGIETSAQTDKTYACAIGATLRSTGLGMAFAEAVSLTSDQEGYRWRDDDGSESAATWLAAQDTNITRAISTNTRLRILTDYTGDPATQQMTLQYRKVGDAATEWRAIP